MSTRMIRGFAIAVALVLFAATPVSAGTTAASTPLPSRLTRWKLALDFRTRPTRNPFPSQLGGPAVWSLRESRSLARTGNYPLMPAFSSSFGSAGIDAWHGRAASCVRLPAIGVNTTKTSKALCAGQVPGGAAFVRPTSRQMPVVAWTSPFDGAFTISHDAVADLDSTCGDGVTYYVDLGISELTQFHVVNGGGMDLPPISQNIHKGQSLFFIVDPGPARNAGCDTTQLQLTIDRVVM